MRILLLSQVFPPQTGGSGRWLWELYRRLVSVDVRVVAGAYPGDQAFDAAGGVPTERIRLRFDHWGISRPRAAMQYAEAFAALSRILRQGPSDVIHCGKCLPEGLLALAASKVWGTRYWCYAHGEELTLARTSRELRALTRLVLRHAEKIVVNSGFTRSLVIAEWGVAEERVILMHPGVDTSRFTPALPDTSVREDLGWTQRTVILTVGALQKRKGQDTTIRALPRILKICPDILYAIVGEGWERQDLERLAQVQGVGDHVRFYGVPTDEDLVKYYQQCDLFVLANRQVGWDVEGFGIVLLEAQACGKPVIAGDSGGTSDAVCRGVSGEIVDGAQPESVAAAIIGLLSDRQSLAEMGQRGRSWVVDRFDWSVHARRCAELFSGADGHGAAGRTRVHAGTPCI
jgi:phosphatidylinositol alpha-1,6-mannosyltransferase